jgi:hypothetical protein
MEKLSNSNVSQWFLSAIASANPNKLISKRLPLENLMKTKLL